MTQEQFQQFWLQLKAPLKAKWEKITDSDLGEIQGNLAKFNDILEKRYGDPNKEEVRIWPSSACPLERKLLWIQGSSAADYRLTSLVLSDLRQLR